MHASKYLTLTVGTATAAVAGMVIGGVGFAAPASIPDKQGQVSLCFNAKESRNVNGGTDLRIYDAGQNSKKCAKGDKKLTINQRGPAGPQGPSAVSASGFVPGNSGVAAGITTAMEGRIADFPNPSFSTAAFALTISNFRLNAAVPVNAANVYQIVVDADGSGPGGFTAAGNCTIVEGATANVADNYCTVAGPIAVPANARYALLVPGTVADNLPQGASTSYVVKPA